MPPPAVGLPPVTLGVARGVAGLLLAVSEPAEDDEKGKVPAAALAMRNTARAAATTTPAIRTQDGNLRTGLPLREPLAVAGPSSCGLSLASCGNLTALCAASASPQYPETVNDLLWLRIRTLTRISGIAETAAMLFLLFRSL